MRKSKKYKLDSSLNIRIKTDADSCKALIGDMLRVAYDDLKDTNFGVVNDAWRWIQRLDIDHNNDAPIFEDVRECCNVLDVNYEQYYEGCKKLYEQEYQKNLKSNPTYLIDTRYKVNSKRGFGLKEIELLELSDDRTNIKRKEFLSRCLRKLRATWERRSSIRRGNFKRVR